MTKADALSAYPVGNVTFVFTDIEGSSGMTRELEKTRIGTYEEQLRDPHRQHLLTLAEQYHSYEIHRVGDGHLLVFQLADDALAFALAFQNKLHEDAITHAEGDKTYSIKVRIGIHTAEDQRQPALTENNLPEYSGGDTNYAARIGSLGIGGQIIVSQATYTHAHQLRNYESIRPKDFTLWPWPGRFLKSFSGPHNVYEITYYAGQEPLEPGMRWFSEWYRSERNRFVDRPDKIKTVNDYFEEKKRIVTITGIGGTGKTRLAIACAARRANLYDDGVYFVSLATTDLVENPQSLDISRNVAFVAEMIGAALKLQGEAAQPEPLFEMLRTKNLLLVLDNYESVHCDPVGEFLIKIATETAGVSLLVTGREIVDADDIETLVSLNEGMTDEEARTLFLDRARLKTTLLETFTPADETQLHRILVLTERLPLALELAAAHIQRSSLQQIADGIQKTPLGEMGTAKGLRADDALALKRHRSLERSLMWSYNLLSAASQRVLAVASLFATTFDETTLQAVYGHEEAAGGLDNLLDCSLVYEAATQPSTQFYRFRLHRATREFATQKLAALPSAEDIRQRFIAHYRQLVAENDNLNNADCRATLTAEWTNAIAAAETARTLSDARAVLALSNLGAFLKLRGLWAEQERLYEYALSAARTAGDRHGEGQTLNNMGTVYQSQGRWEEALQVYQQSLTIQKDIKDRHGEGQTLTNMGTVYQSQGRWEEALQVYQQSLTIQKDMKDRHGEGQTLTNMGVVYRKQGRWEEALKAYDTSLLIFQELGDRQGEGSTLTNMGVVYRNQGRWDEALKAYAQDLQICRDLGDRHGEGQTLNNMGVVYQCQGRWEEALQVYQQSLTIQKDMKDRHGEGQTLTNMGVVYRKQGRWEEALKAYDTSLLIFQELGDRQGEGSTLTNMGVVYQNQGRWEEALRAYAQDMQICRDLGDRHGEGQTLFNIALLLWKQEKRQEALQAAQEAVTAFRQTEDAQTLAQAQQLVQTLSQADA